MNVNQWTSLLGLANRAGKCISGEELVVKEVRRNKAKLVLLAADASENTKKKLTDKCSYYEVSLRSVSDRYTLGNAIGKDQRVVVAVVDQGFASKLQSILDQ
jgi:ribosomal protein L7Ae-like RNA K-turn-binding protein